MQSAVISSFAHENLNGKLPDFDYDKKCARNIEEDNQNIIDYLVLQWKSPSNSSDVGLILRESTISDSGERSLSEVYVEKVKPFSCAYHAKFKPNDQIIRINASLVYCKGQVLTLLAKSSYGASVHILRPQYSVFTNSQPIYTDHSFGHQKESMNLYHQITLTNSQNLRSTISLQQHLLQSLLEKKRYKARSSSEENSPNNNSYEEDKSLWVVRKRSNGVRYITKRSRDEDKPPQRRLLLPGRLVSSDRMSTRSSDDKSVVSHAKSNTSARDNLFNDENFLSVLTI